MVRRFKFFIVLISIMLCSTQLQAQGQDDFLDESLSDMYMVVGSGLGGGVLGLSTLSFVEDPSDHLKNILVGASLGIIIGVAVVAYGQANRSQAQYYKKRSDLMPKFDSSSQFARKSKIVTPGLAMIAHSFTF